MLGLLQVFGDLFLWRTVCIVTSTRNHPSTPRNKKSEDVSTHLVAVRFVGIAHGYGPLKKRLWAWNVTVWDWRQPNPTKDASWKLLPGICMVSKMPLRCWYKSKDIYVMPGVALITSKWEIVEMQCHINQVISCAIAFATWTLSRDTTGGMWDVCSRCACHICIFLNIYNASQHGGNAS